VLVAQPFVREAAVVCRLASSGEPALIGYVAFADGAEGSTRDDLRRSLEQVLPDYMIPNEWLIVEQLPRTRSGKVDRSALRTQDDQEAVADRPPLVEPRDDVERAIAEIWAAVLGVPQIGIHDDFFDLGGHSLLAARAIARMRRSGYPVTIDRFFTSPTIAELATYVAVGAR
jgi:hypothetical protein